MCLAVSFYRVAIDAIDAGTLAAAMTIWRATTAAFYRRWSFLARPKPSIPTPARKKEAGSGVA